MTLNLNHIFLYLLINGIFSYSEKSGKIVSKSETDLSSVFKKNPTSLDTFRKFRAEKPSKFRGFSHSVYSLELENLSTQLDCERSRIRLKLYTLRRILHAQGVHSRGPLQPKYWSLVTSGHDDQKCPEISDSTFGHDDQKCIKNTSETTNRNLTGMCTVYLFCCLEPCADTSEIAVCSLTQISSTSSLLFLIHSYTLLTYCSHNSCSDTTSIIVL